jgi:hypothetical protein
MNKSINLQETSHATTQSHDLFTKVKERNMME